MSFKAVEHGTVVDDRLKLRQRAQRSWTIVEKSTAFGFYYTVPLAGEGTCASQDGSNSMHILNSNNFFLQSLV
jgi:hypothetical protein